MNASHLYSGAEIEELLRAAFPFAPVRMVLHCPACGLQHIDENEWTTRRHRSHLCAGCNHIWRPADVATVGVQSTESTGAADSPIEPQVIQDGKVRQFVRNYFAPWGGWKTAWWEDTVGDDVEMTPSNALRHVHKLLTDAQG